MHCRFRKKLAWWNDGTMINKFIFRNVLYIERASERERERVTIVSILTNTRFTSPLSETFSPPPLSLSLSLSYYDFWRRTKLLSPLIPACTSDWITDPWEFMFFSWRGECGDGPVQAIRNGENWRRRRPDRRQDTPEVRRRENSTWRAEEQYTEEDFRLRGRPDHRCYSSYIRFDSSFHLSW